MAATSPYAPPLITTTHLSKPHYSAASKIQKLSSFHNETRNAISINFTGCCKIPVLGRTCRNYRKRFNLSALSSSSGNRVEVVEIHGAPNGYQNEDEQLIVVNFYRFVFVENPREDVSKHLAFMQGRDIHGRIYLNEQGINAQYSGPSKDALAYVKWVREDDRFSDMLVQTSPAINGHAFPKLKLRYKPSLVQLEEGTSHLPLLDRSMRATSLTPFEWRNRLETVNKTGNSLSRKNTKIILLDVRNGYEWDVGHFQGAQRPNVDCFRSTSFGLSEPEVAASDPLGAVDKENTDILMYCTGGIRCDVYSTMHRQQGFKRLYTLKGGASHYLANEGCAGWIGNLFVFDSRLSLPPSTYNSEISAEASGKKADVIQPFAKCYICESQVSELRHRNCANLDCNLLFLCCLKCVDGLRGCCCIKCTSAAWLRPVLQGHQRYEKWHKYRHLESKIAMPVKNLSRVLSSVDC
ncbi:Rhodanese-like domain-containing protein 8-chloroplastic [Striga hermonthica]|uniref:Rhodanese-like domain-containing protein 8-chloroplastic n=1 Tax=Striga hermonthica TaxID=68872 RepID=A0A9N7RIP8_STRHE|nr:Rhodanese-like domain-containing protein 8-chloroplastic [Striga hermonthica]